MDYAQVLAIDVLTILACGALLVGRGRLRHSHPATIYLLFHGFAFTTRVYGLWRGAPTLFMLSQFGIGTDPVRESEIVRAVILADLSLVIMTVTWLVAARTTPSVQARDHVPISGKIVWLVAVPTIIVGVFGLTFARLPGSAEDPMRNLGEWGESSYPMIIQSWAGLGLLALIHLYGARLWLIVPLVGQLALMGYQGYHRFRVVIPTLLLAQMLIDRAGKRWPSIPWLFALFALFLVMPGMKLAGRMAQAGADQSEIVERVGVASSGLVTGMADDQYFLDELASTLTLVDMRGRLYWGEPYAALLYLPIPRIWWRGKPSIGDYIGDFSTPSRPMRELGMIVTYIGEAYANFSYPGLALIPIMLAWFSGKAYFAAYRRPYGSLERLSYLLVACNLIQVYRDGLVSLVLFVVVNMVPLSLIVVAHQMFGKHAKHGPDVRARQVKGAG